MSEARKVGRDENVGGGNYLKLKRGDSAVVRCVDAPIMFSETFTNDEGREVTTTKFAEVVIVRDPKGDQVKAWKYGKQVYDEIRTLSQKAAWGDPTGYDIEVECLGDLPKYWAVTPVGKSPLSDDERKLVADAALDLEKMFRVTRSDGEYDPFKEE